MRYAGGWCPTTPQPLTRSRLCLEPPFPQERGLSFLIRAIQNRPLSERPNILRSELSSRILRGGMPIYPERLADRVWRFALGSPLGDLLAKVNPDLRPADLDALGLGAGHASLSPLADFLRLDLG